MSIETMDRFERAMALLRVHEGGYINHPKDPGGATNKGVTQRTYNWYRKLHKQPTRSVRQITEFEVKDIYRKQYWDAVKGDDLPSGIAYMVFDGAVNSGPSQSIKWLQRAVGAQADGIMGAETLSKTREKNDTNAIIDSYCDQRWAFMKTLKHFSSFENGWRRRVAEVRAQAKAWAAPVGYPKPSVGDPVDLPKATGEENTSTTIKKTIKDPAAIGSIIASAGGVSALAQGDGPVQWAVAAGVVLAVAVALFFIIRKDKDRARHPVPIPRG